MSRVTVCDVAPRDGLQNDAVTLEPSVRAELVDRLVRAGLPRVEAVSFVNPARVPQMAGAEEVVAALERRPGVVYAGLVLNAAGVICGPIYTIADIFEDPQFKARDMLLQHVDPEFGPYIGPGIVPKLSETPGAVRWSAPWERGSHNREIFCGMLGLTETELAQLADEGVV